MACSCFDAWMCDKDQDGNPVDPMSCRVCGMSATDHMLSERLDFVDHPPHYTYGKFEVIDVIEDWGLGFHEASAVQYIARAKHKGNELGGSQEGSVVPRPVDQEAGGLAVDDLISVKDVPQPLIEAIVVHEIFRGIGVPAKDIYDWQHHWDHCRNRFSSWWIRVVLAADCD